VIDVDFAGKGHLAGSGGGVFRVVGDFDELVLAFRVVVDDKLEGMEDGHGAAGAAVQVVALEVFEHFDVDDAIGARDAGGGGEGADGFRVKPRRRRPERVGIRGSSQALTRFSLTSCNSLRLESRV